MAALCANCGLRQAPAGESLCFDCEYTLGRKMVQPAPTDAIGRRRWPAIVYGDYCLPAQVRRLTRED